jgi:pimeloyl-ACP methyl ester carboxylesterase
MFVSRRTFMAGLPSILGPVLTNPARAADLASGPGEDVLWKRLPLASTSWLARGAFGCVPRQLLDGPSGERPLALMLHGYGQAKSVQRGLNAWRDEYGLVKAYQRLAHPPLTPLFRHAKMLTEPRQREISVALERRPFVGCAAVCPALPVAYPIREFGPAYAEFLRAELLGNTRRELGSSARRASTGVAGVSMGALLALEVALQLPDEFSAVVGMQIDLDEALADHYAERFDAVAQSGRPVQVFVLTSDADVYRAHNLRFYSELARRGLPAELRVTPGPHTGGWVYEVGSVEALLWFESWFGDGSVRTVTDDRRS